MGNDKKRNRKGRTERGNGGNRKRSTKLGSERGSKEKTGSESGEKRKRGRKTASKIWAKKMGVRGKKNNK